MDSSSIQPGDHVWVQCTLYTHHGIATGEGTVIHYLGKGDVHEAGRIAETGFAQFTEGAPLRRRSHPRRLHDGAESVRRARSRVGEETYHLVFNNCEHFVTWCIEGVEDSAQVRNVVTSVGGAVGGHFVYPVAARLVAGAAIPFVGPLVVGATVLGSVWSFARLWSDDD